MSSRTKEPHRTRADRAARHAAAWEELRGSGEEPVVPDETQPIPEATLAELTSTVTRVVEARRVGELLERARLRRGLGKRAAARALGAAHARVSQLEAAENVELRTMLAYLRELDFNVMIVAVPAEGGDGIAVSFPANQSAAEATPSAG